MRDFINRRTREIAPSGIRKFFDIVAEMEDAISLGVGEPDFITPWNVRKEAVSVIHKGYTQYTSNKGLPVLRERISEYLKERFSLNYSEDEIIVTVGASEAIDMTLRATVEPGDEILIPEPCYVSYAPIVSLCGGKAVAVPCTSETSFKLTAEAVESCCNERTKAIILSYPNNPTGAIMEREYLEKVCEVIKKKDLLSISDEIYAELTYGSNHCSVAAVEGMRERTVLINGFSKAFAMTGWRIGYLAAPKYITDMALKIHQYAIMCCPTFSQYAASYALKEGAEDGYQSVAEMHGEYDRRRRFLYHSFIDMGLDCFAPKGAFYMFPSVEKTGLTGDEFAEALLREQKVAVVPGSAFGSSGKYHIRCSYAASMQNLNEAVERIRKFLKSRGF